MFLRSRAVVLALTVTAAACCPSPGAAQSKPGSVDPKMHYTKYEHYIPIRDGKKLFTSIYVPKDSSHTYPFLMMRTPYSVAPYGVDQFRTQLGPTEAFDKAGYIFGSSGSSVRELNTNASCCVLTS